MTLLEFIELLNDATVEIVLSSSKGECLFRGTVDTCLTTKKMKVYYNTCIRKILPLTKTFLDIVLY